jgi:alanine racemase
MDPAKLAVLCDGQNIDTEGLSLGRVCIDSRRCMPGDLFFALQGRTDGHQFVSLARQAGAKVVVVGRGRGIDGPRIEVDDPLEALQRYAGWTRKNRLGKVLAITGSNGKTIVKDALTTVLMGVMKVACSPGSYNSQIGVPLSLLSMPEGLDLAIIEVGVSEPGEMDRQRAMVAPDCGLLTHIGLAHIGAFGDRSVTAREKMRLFSNIGPEGFVILPKDEALMAAEASALHGRVVWHGRSGVVGLEGVEQVGQGSVLRLVFPGGIRKAIGVKTRSRHLIDDLLVAVTAASTLGVSPQHIAEALEGYSCGPTRLEMWTSPQGVMLINDAYSADPLSVQAALEMASQHASPEGRRIFVFGGLNELGARERREHEAIGRLASRQGVTHLVVPSRVNTAWTAAAFLAERPDGVVFERPASEWAKVIRGLAQPGDIILIKGGRGDGLVAEAGRVWESMAGKRLVVDLRAIAENIACFRRLCPGTQMLAMLKAWAYGTELGRMARWLQLSGVDWLGVSVPDEGAMVRRAGVHLPILVTLLDAEEIDKVVRYRLTPAIYSMILLEAMEAAACREQTVVEVHLKVDTGMGRLGVPLGEAEAVLSHLKASKWLRLTGLMTHLSSADDPQADAFTHSQLAQFERAKDCAKALGFESLICHVAATSGAVRFESSRHDMIRLGLGLYGIYPSSAVAEALELQLAMALLGRVVHVQEYAEGQRIGYGGTFVVSAPNTRIGIVQMGYCDGVPWRLSNVGRVSIGGGEVPIVGRVSMDSMAIDLTGRPQAGVGDEVLIFGARDGVELRPERVAAWAGSMPYELIVNIDSRRVQRVFIGD